MATPGQTESVDFPLVQSLPYTNSFGSDDKDQYRVTFDPRAGAVVREWPCKGGFYKLNPCFAVELDFLGLDHFQKVKRVQNSTDEEAR